jgi:peptidoglycan hydrolase-like protein with peptidoglycan-binding domain
MKATIRASLCAVALLLVPAIATAGAPMIGTAEQDQTVVATAPLIREIQFMLLNIGIDPGPIDGNARQLTNRAVHMFQQKSGLPVTDLVNDQPVSQAFVERLRQEAAQALLKGVTPAQQPAAAAPPAAAPAATVVPPPPALDRFASCAHSTADFLVGGQQYTPQAFLDEGFGGVTARAVTNLRQRLDEARQIAEKIGGPALVEVQRQAHVLAYFECRQQIEQSSAAKN